MAFFDKKEDVITIELTPYGRSLLSQGKLNPAFYAFFDDDILYDSEAGGFSEDQTKIQDRIINETSYLKPARDLQSVEKLIFENETSEENPRPHTQLKLNYLTEPMGTSDQTSERAPGWSSTFIQGEITGSVTTTLTGSTRTVTDAGGVVKSIGGSEYFKQIPQINAEIEYKLRVNNTSNSTPVRGMSVSPPSPSSRIFPDGSYLEIIEEQIICNLRETEGFLFKEGLEMEVFIYDQTDQDKLLPLKFLPKTKLIENGILLTNPAKIKSEVDETYVEYYINYATDKNILRDEICKGIKNLRSKDIEVGLEIDCDDEENIFFDIYNTPIDIEDCD